MTTTIPAATTRSTTCGAAASARRPVPEAEFAALVVVETAHRLAAKATEALAAGDADTARRLLAVLAERTSLHGDTAVTDPGVAAEVTRQATRAVTLTLWRVGRDQEDSVTPGGPVR